MFNKSHFNKNKYTLTGLGPSKFKNNLDERHLHRIKVLGDQIKKGDEILLFFTKTRVGSKSTIIKKLKFIYYSYCRLRNVPLNKLTYLLLLTQIKHSTYFIKLKYRQRIQNKSKSIWDKPFLFTNTRVRSWFYLDKFTNLLLTQKRIKIVKKYQSNLKSKIYLLRRRFFSKLQKKSQKLKPVTGLWNKNLNLKYSKNILIQLKFFIPNKVSIKKVRGYKFKYVSKFNKVLRIKKSRFLNKVMFKRIKYTYIPFNKKLVNTKFTNFNSIKNLVTNFTTIKQFNKFQKVTNFKYLFNKVSNGLVIVKKSPLNKMSIHSLRYNSFILKNVGLFITYQNRLLYKHKNIFKSQLKKKLLSFLYPEQEKRNLFMRKKKSTLTSLVRNSSKYSQISNFFSFKNILNVYKQKSALLQLNSLDSNQGFSFNNLFTNSTKSNYSSSFVEVLYKDHHKTKGIDNRYLHTIRDVKLGRIRFKPGYQRLWRQARSALQVTLGLNFQYQKRLTKYVTRYFNQLNRYLFSSSESSLDRIVLYSHLVPESKTLTLFFDSGFIFINGQIVLDIKRLISPNDIIQLIVSNWYYITFRWLQNWSLTRVKKLKRLIYRKGLASKHKLMKTRKKPSRYTPFWIYNMRYDGWDVKPYLEVDYLTLSVFLINDPFLMVYYSPDDLPDLRLSLYRMYNWKYIT